MPPATPFIIRYWNYNNTTAVAAATTATYTVGGAGLTYAGTCDSNLTGSLINARNGDSAGTSICLLNPAGTINIAVPQPPLTRL